MAVLRSLVDVQRRWAGPSQVCIPLWCAHERHLRMSSIYHAGLADSTASIAPQRMLCVLSLHLPSSQLAGFQLFSLLRFFDKRLCGVLCGAATDP